jgi:hypothetical protein
MDVPVVDEATISESLFFHWSMVGVINCTVDVEINRKCWAQIVIKSKTALFFSFLPAKASTLPTFYLWAFSKKVSTFFNYVLSLTFYNSGMQTSRMGFACDLQAVHRPRENEVYACEFSHVCLRFCVISECERERQ